MPPTDAERLKLIRSEQGSISQQKLADRLGIAAHRIKDIEVGKTKISTEIALQLEDKFHYSFKWLLTGKGEPHLNPGQIPGNSGAQLTAADSPNEARALDAELLKRIIMAIEKELADRDLIMPADKKAEAVALLYELFSGTQKEVTKDTIGRYLKLVA